MNSDVATRAAARRRGWIDTEVLPPARRRLSSSTSQAPGRVPLVTSLAIGPHPAHIGRSTAAYRGIGRSRQATAGPPTAGPATAGPATAGPAPAGPAET